MMLSGLAKYTYSNMQNAEAASSGRGTTHIDFTPSFEIFTISPEELCEQCPVRILRNTAMKILSNWLVHFINYCYESFQ